MFYLQFYYIYHCLPRSKLRKGSITIIDMGKVKPPFESLNWYASNSIYYMVL